MGGSQSPSWPLLGPAVICSRTEGTFGRLFFRPLHCCQPGSSHGLCHTSSSLILSGLLGSPHFLAIVSFELPFVGRGCHAEADLEWVCCVSSDSPWWGIRRTKVTPAHSPMLASDLSFPHCCWGRLSDAYSHRWMCSSERYLLVPLPIGNTGLLVFIVVLGMLCAWSES